MNDKNIKGTPQNINKYILYYKDAISKYGSTGWVLKWDLGEIWVKSPGYFVGWCGDSYAEILASAIEKGLGLTNYVKYRPCIVLYNNKIPLLCSESDDFTPGNIKLVTITELIKAYNKGRVTKFGLNDLIKLILESTGVNYTKHLEDMLLLDYINCNTDRRYNKFGLIVDTKHRVIKEAPIFNNGNSLDLGLGFPTEQFNPAKLEFSPKLFEPFKLTQNEQVKLIRPIRKWHYNSK